MSGKCSILERNYEERVWSVTLYTNSRFTAIEVWIKALFRYELVEFTVRKWEINMQIVIDIPDENYQVILTKIMLACYGCKIKELKKGHGKLFDVNDILGRIGLEDNESNRDENAGEIVTLEDFDYIPAIVEADTESEDKDD